MITNHRLLQILCLAFLLCLVSEVNGKKINTDDSSNRNCKYFESLRKSPNCETFNKGKTIEVQPSGKNKDLYRVAYKMINSELGGVLTREPKEEILFDAIKIDLNNDGVDEAILSPRNSGYFVGATGVSEFYIFQKESNKWKLIGVVGGVLLNIDKRRTNNYLNIITCETHAESYFSIYKMNRSGKYKLVKQIMEFCSPPSIEDCYRSRTKRPF